MRLKTLKILRSGLAASLTLLMISCTTTYHKPTIDVSAYDCDLQGFQTSTTFVPDKLACQDKWIGMSLEDWIKHQKAVNECEYLLKNK